MRNRWIVGLPTAGLAAALALTALSQTGRSPGAETDENSNGPPPANNVAGHPGNTAGPGVGGATIAGGGPHQVTADFGTIGGGSANTAAGSFSAIGGGVENQASGSRSVVGGGRANAASGAAATVSGGYTNAAAGDYATVSGGWRNQSTGYVSTIGGGWENIATGQVAVIGGGQFNTALAAAATVSGGWRNRAEGAGAMIPGGRDNIALGEYSLAAGRNANAQHAGTFIWSDSTETGFSSTDINQFLIQAAGNVGIDTDQPHEKLTVAGNIAPAQDGTFSLGTETTRWERLYLSEAVDYPDVFIATSGGATNLQLDQTGNLRVAGSVTATQFIGDGSKLTGIQTGSTPLADGSITIDKLDLAGLDERYVRIGQASAVTTPIVTDVPAVAPPPTSDAVTVDAQGQVGLGTTAPRAQLHVAGQVLIEGGEPGAGKVLTSDESGLATWQTPSAAATTGDGTGATRIEQNEQSPNLISGHPANTVGDSTIGATITGGGRVGKANRAKGNFTTVGGGMGNEINGPYSTIGGGFGNIIFNSGSTIGGGIGNTVSNWNVTVSGGRDNNASGLGATIGGGRGNIATNRYATIPGGYFNTASGPGAAVGGGFANIADGFISTVPGGSQNEANGEYSMAAGRRAKALHSGTFVWGDSLDEDIASTTSNQVVFRAGGGVGINTTDTPEALNVAGNILTRGIVFTDSLVVSAGGDPLVQIDDQGNLLVSGTIKAAGYDGASLPLAPTGTTTQTDSALAANAVGSEEIRDGAVQLEDLDLAALDERYAKAGEAASVPVAAAAPEIKPNSISSVELVDGTIQPDDLDLEALDGRYVQPDALAKATANTLSQDTLFEGSVTGTAANLVIREGAVQLQHLDLETIDARYAKADDIPTNPSENLKLEELDERYITSAALSAAAASALSKTSEFGGAVSGTASNLVLQEGVVQLHHLDLEAIDARYAKAGETSAVQVVASAPVIEPGSIDLDHLNLDALDGRYTTPADLSAAAASSLTKTSAFGGAVSGTASNLVLQEGVVQLHHLDLEAIDARYAKAGETSAVQVVASAPVIEPGSIDLDHLNLDALDERYITPTDLSAAAASALSKTSEFGGMASGTYSNFTLQDGAVQLHHLDLEAIDARYAKAGETSTVQTIATAPLIEPGSIDLDLLNLEALDERYITPTDLSAAAASALSKTSEFGGMASGTYSNFTLQDGAVQLHHLDLEAIDARYTRAGETSAVPAVATIEEDSIGSAELINGAVTLEDLDIDALDQRYAKAGETSSVPVVAAAIEPGSVDLEDLNLEAIDEHYITQADLSAAAASALSKASEFGGVASGTYSNLSINAGSIGGSHIEDASIGIADLKIEELDSRYAPAGAVSATSTSVPLPQIITPSQVSGIALTQDSSFSGHVAGPFTNLQLQADSVGSDQIQDGAVGIADLDIETLDARYAELLKTNLPNLLPVPAAMPSATKVADGSIDLDKLNTDSLDERYATVEALDEIAAHAHDLPSIITSNGLTEGSVQSAAIADGTIALRDVDLASFDERYPTVEEMNRLLDDKVATSTTTTEGVEATTTLEIDSVNGTHIQDGTVAAADLDLENIDARYVKREGDTLSGPLALPSSGLTVGEAELVVRDGRVGIGVAEPTTALDIAGSIRIAGGEPGEGKLLVSDHDGAARWAAPEELSLGREAADPEDVRYGSVFGPRIQQPLNLQVAGKRALRIEPTAVSPNLIGGSDGNTVKPRTVGATISGGGNPDQPSRIDADFGTIGGGAGNLIEGAYGTIGGGWDNLAEGARSTIGGGRLNAAKGAASTVGGGFTNIANGSYATIGGGYANVSDGYVATIAGGWGNNATGTVSTIGGGQDNTATGSGATVAGGWKNRAEGLGAIVPGGKANTAKGAFSAALGLRSQALHDGAFVWSDSEDAEFASTANDQFLIKARGNVGIDDNNPTEKLTVKGNIAPTTHRRFNLGSPTARWETLYLGSTLDIANPLRITQDGKPILAISPDGDLNVPGTIIGKEFIGDGSGLKNLPAQEIANASIGLKHLSDEVRQELSKTTTAVVPPANTANDDRPISPTKVQGIAVTRADRFDGEITGTYNELKLRDGTIEKKHLSKELAASLTQPAPDTSTVDSLTTTGTVTAARFVGDGSALTGIETPKLKPASVADIHIRPDAAISPAKVKGIAITRDDTFGGAVLGPFNKLALRDGTVSMQHLAKDVTDAINQPAQDPGQVDSLTTTGTITAAKFVGDGSALTGIPVPKTKPASIRDIHIQPNAAVSPAKIKGIAVTREDRFDGAITGPFNKLTIRDGAVTMQHLGKNVADALKKEAAEVTDLDPSAIKGTALTQADVLNGVVVGSPSNLHYRASSITAPAIADGAVTMRHLGEEVVDAINQPAPDVTNLDPSTIKGVAVTQADQFAGAVTGPYNQLALRDGAVSMQHLGPDVTDAINKPAPKITNLDPSAIQGVALTQSNAFDGAVTGPYNQLALRNGAVSMQHLGQDVTNAINKPAPIIANLDPSTIKGIALTRKDVLNGVVVGSLSNTQYRTKSITGPAVADGAISLRHIDAAVLNELKPELPDFTRVAELTVNGPLRANRLLGDGSGLTNIPFAAVKVPNGAVNADMLAPQSVYVENLAPGLAKLVQRELPDLDRLTDLTLRGTLNARRLAGDGSAITGLQFSALKIPADSISGELIRPGSIGKKHLAPELAELGASGWLLGGNRTGGSRPAVLGTMNEAPLHVVVGGQPILRLRPGTTSPIFIAGHSSNAIDAGAEGAVIGGGGAAGSPNLVAQRYGTVSGGINNQARNEFVTIGGGSGNVAAGFDATIAGGQDNQAGGSGAMIGGGFTNVAAGSFSTIAGGAANRAAGNVAAISGGYGNTASGSHATVPGGSLNDASGDYSLAAGRRALARHPGSFVWSDGSDTEIASTAANQFVAQASGGIRLLSDSAGRAGVQLRPGSGSWSTLSDRSMKENFTPVDAQQILDAVVALPLNSWNYTTQKPAIRHIGPTAQDFRAAFKLGAGDTHITGVDAQGVALAAIQGMHKLLSKKDEQIQALEKENRTLAERIGKIEQQLDNPEISGTP